LHWSLKKGGNANRKPADAREAEKKHSLSTAGLAYCSTVDTDDVAIASDGG
jgi:hypothetical protein